MSEQYSQIARQLGIAVRSLALKLLNLLDKDGRAQLGVVRDGEVHVVTRLASHASSPAPLCTDDVVRHPELLHELQAFDKSELGPVPDSKMRYAPCVLNPQKIICVGLNYRQHAIESRMPIPAHPVLFSKFNNSLAGHNQAIGLPKNAVQYDYEVELGVVIGTQARNVVPERALEHVFGYCTINDLSARDLQFQTSQWLLGKTLDHFMPMGPFLVTRDEVPDPQALDLKCWVNGELRQNSSTVDMIFSVRELISHISSYFTLNPGDVISTGTPQGVIFGMSNPVWLKWGDVTTVEIGGLGRLVNRYAEF